MKTIVFEIVNPTKGDLVIINASAPKGGKISAKHLVVGERLRPQLDNDGFVVGTERLPPDDPRSIAANLSAQIGKDWMPECVQAKVKPDTGALVINCTDLFSDVSFTTEVHGDGGTTMTMLEF